MSHSLGNTMWLDPLVHREWLPNIGQWSQTFNVRTLLLEQTYATENPQVFTFVSCVQCFYAELGGF